jgi:hypothetical protein
MNKPRDFDEVLREIIAELDAALSPPDPKFEARQAAMESFLSGEDWKVP